MKPHLAINTMLAFDRMVQADQGKAFRGHLQRVLPHIGDAYRQDEDAHRSHMGASLIGQECPRAIWYDFRWVSGKNFEGRLMRLFNRGHLEEGRLIALLLTIGCQVFQQDENGKQFRVSHAEGHFGGSGDGVVIGVPDLPPGQPSLCEFKTHNAKSFAKLAGSNWQDYWRHVLEPERYAADPFEGAGVKEAKPEHYVQMQIYMRKMGIPVALYVASNKDTDHIYCELVSLAPYTADEYLGRGEQLVWMDKPPAKLNISPGFYKCKFCDFRPVCHLKQAPERNCRTCEFSRPAEGGQWLCRVDQVKASETGFVEPPEVVIDKATQLTGCPQYEKKACL